MRVMWDPRTNFLVKFNVCPRSNHELATDYLGKDFALSLYPMYHKSGIVHSKSLGKLPSKSKDSRHLVRTNKDHVEVANPGLPIL
jgi:hypothetical protein